MNKFKLSSSLNTFELSKSDVENLDITKLKAGNSYHLISEGKNYHIEAVDTQNDKQIVLLVNGRRVEFSLQSELDQLIDQLGFSSNKEKSVKEIRKLNEEISALRQENIQLKVFYCLEYI